jgi:hypothetical protein
MMRVAKALKRILRLLRKDNRRVLHVLLIFYLFLSMVALIRVVSFGENNLARIDELSSVNKELIKYNGQFAAYTRYLRHNIGELCRFYYGSAWGRCFFEHSYSEEWKNFTMLYDEVTGDIHS